MIATRRTTFRLYPNQAQTAKLFEWRRLHHWLYNQALSDRQLAYKRDRKSVSYYDQQRAVKVIRQVLPEFKELGSHALQATVKRVDFAYNRFFQGLGGYPRFKSLRHYSGWTYPCNSGWKTHTTGVNGYLDISNLGHIQMRGKARNWGNPTTLTIVYRNKKWYASITVACDVQRETGSGLIGLDFGCNVAVMGAVHLGNDEYEELPIDNPRHLKQVQTKIKLANHQKRRKRAPNYNKRIKASKGWRKANGCVSKLVRIAASQRQDFIHQVAAQIVSSNSMVATEKLNFKNMTKKAKKGSKRKAQKTGLNRSILDVGMGMLRSAIEYKVNEAGGIFVEVPTQKVKPSQRCPKCDHVKPKTLSERIHKCENCSYTCDRDFASAQVCAEYLRTALGTSVEKRRSDSSTSTHCGGFKQVSEMKRQKPRPSS
ncbi:transposase IS891/IS1136/IS1341 family [Crinalium epipsammum PCC 9333]|uniref:Transposase IS891/IS1136/IS1341 family n=1 Tax=Crinalium epipsammum PCC 9333 TaxID=1173022 RepID=K9VZQ6_9CYAN|nr:RNA-guided endonuclease TnpB family protein [Crinalium epipsammum]AFZ12640.1 transposase IS891/IS1136/IS1341 family [Crinalium epipsammum PCC 9333]